MSIYYKHLNLNIPVINDSAPLQNLKLKEQTDMNSELKSYIHPEFLNLLKSKNVLIGHIESFYTYPGIKMKIHTDCDGGDYIKINYVMGGKNSLMNWYQPKLGHQPESKLTSINTVYLSFEDHQVDLIDSTMINPLTIVQVGSPHNITNTVEFRLCISMVILHADANHQRLTMAEATEIFSEYIFN